LDWVGFFQIRRESFQRRLGRGRRYPGFKPAQNPHLRSLSIVNRSLDIGFEIVRDLIVNTHRQPNFRRKNLHRADETLWRDSDDRERATVDDYLGAEYVWIEVVLLPVTVTDNRDRSVVARRFLFRQKCTASRQRNAEHGEIV